MFLFYLKRTIQMYCHLYRTGDRELWIGVNLSGVDLKISLRCGSILAKYEQQLLGPY